MKSTNVAQTPTALVGDLSPLETDILNTSKAFKQGWVDVEDGKKGSKDDFKNLSKSTYTDDKPREIDHIKPLPKASFTHDQLLEALYWMHQIFERANMTLVLIKETGKAAQVDRELSGDGIYLAARALEWESSSRGVIDAMAPYAEETDELVTYKANNGVPVYIRICQDDYCISSPDQKLYMHEYVKLPNPFDRFEEVFGK